MSDKSFIRIKRIYDPPAKDDGFRVLVDRLWPRGVKKQEARIDRWAKEVAPTTELRKWFDHDPIRFEEFSTRYLAELRTNMSLVSHLVKAAGGAPMTLLFAAQDRTCNHAVVLLNFIVETGLDTRAPKMRSSSSW